MMLPILEFCQHECVVIHADLPQPTANVLWPLHAGAVTDQVSVPQAFRARIVAGEDFGALASSESHCSSAKRGGDLGAFG